LEGWPNSAVFVRRRLAIGAGRNGEIHRTLPYSRAKISATLQVRIKLSLMFKKPKKKTFRFDTIMDDHIITGTVAFSPAPDPGIFTELARFEAQRILAEMVKEEIAAGRL
jgi:hypothetical protein